MRKWGSWVLEEAKKEIGRFYPEEEDGSIPVGYIWARTIPCQNPSCGAEIPLMRQYGFSGEISDLTRFYVLWRWDYGEAKVHFDEARKLAQSCGVDIAQEWDKQGFIKKEKEFIKVIGPQDRKMEDLKDSLELIDVLHHALLLWEKGKRDEMITLLDKSGFGKSEAFYRVAQAVSETIPIESKEKKLLDGFLAGRERLKEAIREKQGELFR